MTKITYIPGEIANAAIDEHGNRKPVTRTQHIFDDSKGKSQAEVNKDVDNTLALHQSEINALDSQNYVTVDTFEELPATGALDTIYRVANYDGTQVVTNKYAEYAWNGTQYKLLDVKEHGIDDEPTAGSDNFVKSGGVYNHVLETKNNIVPHDKSTNYIDKNTLLKDSFIDEDGAPHHFDGFYATDYVELEEGVTYYFDNLFNGYYAFYDENRNVIVAHGNDQSLQSPFTIPNGARLGRFTIISTAHTLDSWISTSNAMPKAYKKSLNENYWPENIDKEWKEGIEDRLNDIVIHNPISNYIDRNKIKSDCYIDEHGSEVPYSGMFATDYIGLENNVQYYFDNVYNGYYAFYNSEKELVEGHGNDQSLQSPFTIPASARYARFTILNASHIDDCWISINNSIPSAYSEEINPKYLPEEYSNIYCDYKGNEFSLFNRCLCIGDSMTSGTFNYSQQGQGDGYIEMAKYSYPTFLKKLTGVETVNMGVGGYTSVQWWNAYQNEDLSGYDIALIQLGINDLKLGGWTQASIDAFTNIINKLKAENTGIKIFIATIIPALAYPRSRFSAISDGIRALVRSINDVDVILADLEVYGHTADDVAYSCGHLSAYGYLQLAHDWKGIVGYIINTNKNIFREVQFIGTNYNYTDPY